MLNLYKYAKSFVYEEKKDKNFWTSVLILFVVDGKMFIDYCFIIDGNFPENIYSFFCNFNNFIIINQKLHYKFPEYIKEIDPKQVHLHLRLGNSPFSLPKDKLNYWNLHFTSLKNRLYKEIENELKTKKIEIIVPNESLKRNKIPNILNVFNPLFLKKQIYDDNSVMFSDLNIKLL
jgi:hypothetical protein